jgi:hypothetical protein
MLAIHFAYFSEVYPLFLICITKKIKGREFSYITFFGSFHVMQKGKTNFLQY